MVGVGTPWKKNQPAQFLWGSHQNRANFFFHRVVGLGWVLGKRNTPTHSRLDCTLVWGFSFWYQPEPSANSVPTSSPANFVCVQLCLSIFSPFQPYHISYHPVPTTHADDRKNNVNVGEPRGGGEVNIYCHADKPRPTKIWHISYHD